MSSYIESQFDGTTLASASGFLVKREGKVFLVTNRHVVRGRHQDTDEVLDKTHAAIPNSIRVLYLRESQYNLWGEMTVRLVDDDENPLWFEHPIYKGQVDVVAILLPELEGKDVLAYDPWATPHALVDPSERLSIVGFPYGIISYTTLGVWVQGFVATQTQVHHGGLPCFLIDSRTRKGQSGSPVIFYSGSGSYVSLEGTKTLAGGSIVDFVGVYSGRISEDSDLGTVWKAEVVRDIISARL
jgi:hypothetical protein